MLLICTHGSEMVKFRRDNVLTDIIIPTYNIEADI